MTDRATSDSSRLREQLIASGALVPAGNGPTEYVPRVETDLSRPRLALDEAARRAARRAQARSQRAELTERDLLNEDVVQLAQRRKRNGNGANR